MLLTLLDVVLIIIMLVSAFLALMRGFTREVLSIASWAAAAVAALLVYGSSLRGTMRAEFSQPIIGDAVLVLGTFVLTLLVVGMITARISDAILDSRIGALDRSAGFLFGLFRGLVIVVIGYLFFNWLVQEDKQPTWVREARALPVLKTTGEWIKAQLPSDPEETFNKFRKKNGDVEKEEQPEEPATSAPPPPADDDNPDAYDSNEQQNLDKLMQDTEKKPGNP
jgi:membrane protein required for colicin V production